MSNETNLKRIEDWCNNMETEVVEYAVVEPGIIEKPIENNIDNWKSCYRNNYSFDSKCNKVTGFCIKYPIGINYENKKFIFYIKYGKNCLEKTLWFGTMKFLIMMHKLANTLKIKYDDDSILLFFSMKTLLGDFYKFPDDIYFVCNDNVIDISYCYSDGDIYKEYTELSNIVGCECPFYIGTKQNPIVNWYKYHQPIAMIIWTNKNTTLLSVDIIIEINNKKFYKTIDSFSISKYHTKKEIGYYVPMNIVTFDNFSKCIKKSTFPDIIDFSDHSRNIGMKFADEIDEDVHVDFIHKKMNT